MHKLVEVPAQRWLLRYDRARTQRTAAAAGVEIAR